MFIGLFIRAAVGALLAFVFIMVMATFIPSHAATPKPATPTGLPSTIEPLARYVEQTSCDPRIKPGTQRLASLLTTTYPGTSWYSTYACGTDGNRSEHYDGRALDWMVDIHNAAQHADATAFLAWLLATDSKGNTFAMARRLGVMYVIYDNRQWGGWSGKWESYNACASQPQAQYDNLCHRTHMHISLAWNGATATTSFWTKHVGATDYGPCRPSDLNWAPLRTKARTTACPRFAAVSAQAGASALKVGLVKYSGAGAHRGSNGPVVQTVQRDIGVPVTGIYDDRTWNAILGIQKRHGLAQNGNLTQETWRVLLAARR